jgi:hypothetical protein
MVVHTYSPSYCGGWRGSLEFQSSRSVSATWQDAHLKKYRRQIPRWRLEGGSRKRASYSEILERCWRHTLQAKPLEEAKLWPLHTSSPHRESPLHVKRRNQEGPQAASRLRPDGIGRCGPGELTSTMVLPQTTLGQISTAPWTDWPPPREKRETE